jgi:hypothetical protein
MLSVRFRAEGFAAAAVLTALAATCDIPTKAPNFTATPTVKAPLIFSEGLLFLGPGENGEPALVDTTSPDFDSLFTVDPSDRSIYVVRDVDRIDLDDGGTLFDPFDIGPAAMNFRLGEFETHVISGSATEIVGLQDGAARTTPAVPHEVENGRIYFPGNIENILANPSSDLLVLNTSSVLVFGFSLDSAPLNRLEVRLTNNAGTTLTDGAFAASSLPGVELVDPSGIVVQGSRFDRVPADGETVSAVLDLAGAVVPAGSRLRLDVGTAAGMNPIVSNATSLGLSAAVSGTRFRSFVLDGISAQSNINVSESFVLQGSQSFDGVLLSDGVITLVIRNSLPIPLDLDNLRIENEAGFGGYPVGHVAAATSGGFVAADGTTTITIPIGNEGLASRVRVFATLSTAGSMLPTTLEATDGLFIDVSASVNVENVYVIPEADIYHGEGFVDFNAPDFELDSREDFVELASGTLDVREIMNEYSLGIDALVISFPDVLFPPYNASDSLVVTVPSVAGSSGPHARSISLAGARIHAEGGQIRYHIEARSETSSFERVLRSGDRLVGEIIARDLVPRIVSARIDPFSVAVTDDTNNDDLLDVLSDEARVVEIDRLDDFYRFGLEGLRLLGAELTLEITTDIGAEIELVGSLAGVRRTGEVAYLEGRNEFGVAPTDSLSNLFVAAGAAITPDQLLKLSIDGDTAGKVVTRRMIFNDTNSNVGDFVANLPEDVRLVARAVISRDGDRVVLSDPYLLEADVSLLLPLAFRGSLSLTHTLEADMSSIEELIDPSTSVEVEIAEVALEYSNAIPLGINARFHFLDVDGNETIVLPQPSDPPVIFGASPSDEDGFAVGSSDGRVVFPLSDDRLRALARSRTVSVVMEVDTGDDAVGRVRASDMVSFALSGNFDVQIGVGN